MVQVQNEKHRSKLMGNAQSPQGEGAVEKAPLLYCALGKTPFL